MTRRSRTEIQLDALVGLMQSFAARTPTVLDLLRETAPDGYPTSTMPGGPTGSGSSSTETQALIRAQQNAGHDWQIILTTIDTCARSLHAGLAALDRHQRPHPDDVARARCTGGMGQPGAIDWGKPDCTNIATHGRGGLCDACRMRRDRWRRQGDAA